MPRKSLAAQIKKLEYDKAWKKANPERVREHRRREYLKKNPDAERKRPRSALPPRPRPDVCEVCSGSHPVRRLSLDHCHKTGAFRGWLCHWCNVALGYAKDNPKTLRALADYLERGA